MNKGISFGLVNRFQHFCSLKRSCVLLHYERKSSWIIYLSTIRTRSSGMCGYECSFPRITKSSSCFNVCNGVVNMKTVREFNKTYIAQGSIISTVMYMYVVFVICLYYLIKKISMTYIRRKFILSFPCFKRMWHLQGFQGLFFFYKNSVRYLVTVSVWGMLKQKLWYHIIITFRMIQIV